MQEQTHHKVLRVLRARQQAIHNYGILGRWLSPRYRKYNLLSSLLFSSLHSWLSLFLKPGRWREGKFLLLKSTSLLSFEMSSLHLTISTQRAKYTEISNVQTCCSVLKERSNLLISESQLRFLTPSQNEPASLVLPTTWRLKSSWLRNMTSEQISGQWGSLRLKWPLWA